MRKLASRWRRTLAALIVCSVCVVTASPTFAQTGDAATETVNSLNQRAMERFGAGHHAEARLLLKKALRVCNTSGLTNNPLKARTHVNMGVVLLAGFRDKQTAVAHFRQAVRIQPDITVPAATFTPEMASAFKEASTPAAAAPAAVPPPAAEVVPAAAPAAVNYQQPGAATRRPSAPSKYPVAVAPPAPVRPAPQASELPPEEEGMGPEAAADVPPAPAAPTGYSPRYGTMPGSSQRPATPPGSSQRYGTMPGSSQRYGTMPGSSPAPARPAESSAAPKGPRRWHVYLGFAIGVGGGYAVGKTETLRMKTQPGMATAEAFHIAPELGIYGSDTFMVSGVLRYQSISSVNVKNSAEGLPLQRSAMAGYLKLTWMASKLGFRPYFNLAIGGGTIRHVVKFPTYTVDCGGVTCLDNVAASGFMAGPGFGFFIDLGSNLHLVAAAQALVIAGGERTTFNVDGTGGLSLSF